MQEMRVGNACRNSALAWFKQVDCFPTFFVAAHHASHVVSVESGQVPIHSESESVPGPLKHALLVLHPARQGHVLALNGDLNKLW